MSKITTYSQFRQTLPADAAALADEMDLASGDWGDLKATLTETLWTLCEVLRGFESPAWGNTGGRYGHSGGFLTEADWTAIEHGDEDHEGFADFANPYALIAAGQHATANGEAALVSLADAVRDLLATLED